MKYYSIFILLFASIYANATTVTITKPCSEEIAIEHDYSLAKEETVGSVTIATLETLAIPYVGAELGINSIFNTPTDMEAYDIISKSEMKAYGWCYTINGVEPNKLANEILVEPGDQIVWWFAFAHYKDGQWISQCEPSSLTPEFCKENE